MSRKNIVTLCNMRALSEYDTGRGKYISIFQSQGQFRSLCPSVRHYENKSKYSYVREINGNWEVIKNRNYRDHRSILFIV